MHQNPFKTVWVTCLLVVTLVATSFGGALATAAYAAAPEQIKNEVEDKQYSTKDILTGVLAVGLIAALVNGGDDDKAEISSPNTPQPKPQNPSPSVSAAEQQAFNLLNADRAKYGLPPLKLNAKLTKLAGDYAQDMINRNFFSHYNPEGQSPFDRMNQYGIRYTMAGENLAINSSVAGAQKAFMNSAGHRANILNPNYTEVGVGVRYDSKGAVYVVQEFIRP